MTPANVNVVSFGRKLGSVPLQGAVFAQPLYISNVTMSDGKTHDLVVVATEHDQVYAIDADTYQIMWQRNFLGSQGLVKTAQDLFCGETFNSEIGITGTPVIDPVSETVYLVAATKSTQTGQPQYFQRIYALNLQNGQDRVSPSTITTPSGSDYGQALFDPLLNLQRSSLMLYNANVYVSWASHCDNGGYSGWVMAFNAGSLQTSTAWTPDPSGIQGGIWMSGGGPSVDASGNIFLAVGNGWSDAPSGGTNYGDTVVRLRDSGNTITVADYFMPYDYTKLLNEDLDLGAGTPVLLPTQSGARYPNLLITGGKDGTIYLLNRSNLGQWQANNDSQVLQSFQIPGAAIFDTPLFWNNTIYYGITGMPMQAFAYDPSAQQINTTPISSSSMTLAYPGASPALSSNDGSDAVLWSLEGAGTLGVLRAFDPTDLSTELYDSEMSPGRDGSGEVSVSALPR